MHGRRKRKFNLLVDLQKAYDSVDRRILWKLLKERCKGQHDRFLVDLIARIHNESTIQIGMHTMNAEMGLPQGSILSPVLFNVYLEEALKSSAKLEEVRKRGDLLAFADDMLVMSNSQPEVEMIINEMAALQHKWNLRLNKKKSEILTNEKTQEIAGVRCTSTVKYLGVRVTCDRSEQTKISREQIDKNVKILRWKIGKADPDVVQQLTCCLARAMLIYIGTPMVAAGLWKRVDVDGIEASLYRKIMRIGNNIPNKAILNTMTNIRLAGEVINYLSRSAQDEFRK